jgi:hypothetical protein
VTPSAPHLRKEVGESPADTTAASVNPNEKKKTETTDYLAHLLRPDPTYATLGWTRYVLPDGSAYFRHAELKVTTDADLTNTSVNAKSSSRGASTTTFETESGKTNLQKVMEHIERTENETPVLSPPGCEVYLDEKAPSVPGAIASASAGRGASLKGAALRMVRSVSETVGGAWVDHNERVVRPAKVDVGEMRDAEVLEARFRYWTFFETHPCHVRLPAEAHQEALDALTWSYSDRLLHTGDLNTPFSQAECQDIIPFLRSLVAPSDHGAGEGAVVFATGVSDVERVAHTRVVARVLARHSHAQLEIALSSRTILTRPHTSTTTPVTASATLNALLHLPLIGRAVRYMLGWYAVF